MYYNSNDVALSTCKDENIILSIPTSFFTIDDRVDFQVGDIYHVPHYMTTTKDNWKHKTMLTAKTNNSTSLL